MRSFAHQHDVLFETMQQGVVYQDREGRIKSVNRAAEAILGVPRAELVQRTASEVASGSIREDGAPVVVGDFPATVALRTGVATSHVTIGYPSPGGRGVRWLSICAVPLFDEGDERAHGVYSMFEDVTERREVELRRAEQAAATARFAAIAQAVPGVIISTSPDEDGVTRAEFATDAIMDVMGIPFEAFTESLEAGIVRVDDRDRLRLLASIVDARVHSTDWHEEFRYDHPTKGMRWIEGWMRAVQELDGPRWHGFLMDVTERHTAEAALRDEKTKYKALFEAMNDAVYITNTDGTIVDANPAACRMHGMTLEELCARGRDGVMVRDAALQAVLAERTRTGSALGEVAMVHKDGTVFPAELYGTVLGPMPGGWNGIVLARDITHRKRAEAERLRADAAELARSEVERIAVELREAQRIAGVGSFAGELSTGNGFWSEEMFRIMGRDPASGVPNLVDAGQFARADVHERVMAQMNRLLQTGEPLVTEFEISPPDGVHRQVVMRMEPTRDSEGTIVGVRGTYQDVTEQRALEEQLSKSQRLDAVGALAAGVAHDFNNLLGIIVGYAQCAQADLPEDSPTREDLAEVVAAGLRGASLTRRLLTFASRENVQPVLHQPGDVIRDMGNMLGRLISEDISLTFSIESSAGAVFADPGQIEQVLMNLVINARDAMPKGGALSVAVQDAEVGEGRAPIGVVPGSFVEISVTDTGVGMDEATKAHMFDAFFTTKASGRGTGLGLSTVQRIVRQCGGYLQVDTRVGEGTRVAFLLPRLSASSSADATAQAALGRGIGGAGTVLLVEDDPALRSFAERSLARGGFRVLAAAGGDEALRIVNGGAKVDVLLTDVVMPGMGGVEVYHAVRDLVPDVPVLFMSGYVGDNQARHEMLSDPRHFLAKPFAAEDLVAKVGQVLHHGENGMLPTPLVAQKATRAPG